MSSSSSSAVSLPPDISRGYQLLAVQWSIVSVAVILVCLRFCIRGLLRKKVRADDYTILASLACALALSILATFQVRNGFGRNIQYLDPTQIKNIMRDMFVAILFSLTGTFFVRISVCLFILQLLPFTKRFFRWWTYGLMVFFAIITTATFICVCFQCIPIQGFWDKSINARCISLLVIAKINEAHGGKKPTIAYFPAIAHPKTAFSVFMDILCVLLPIMVFRKVQMSWQDKLAVFTLLGLGLLTAGAAAAKTALFNFGDNNITWNAIPNVMWACLEQNIGIIVASIPALRQLFTMFKKQRNPQHSHSSEKPFAGASPFITSPLSPLTEEQQTGHIPSPDSPAGSITKTMEIKLDVDNGDMPNATTSMVPRLEPIKLPMEKARRGYTTALRDRIV
ncbi:MAG: hypothetical protein ASARMPRED_005264 [Alectoria sarmentosa]|nr:MAG: hypothetical protein ASARMPRED_005264 [Alectoria sarmentosa]